MIQKEGIDTLAEWELQDASRMRGMRSFGMPKERLKLQLEQWLDLHLNEKIPSSLLLLSRTLYMPEHLSASEQLVATIRELPESTVRQLCYVHSPGFEDVSHQVWCWWPRSLKTVCDINTLDEKIRAVIKDCVKMWCYKKIPGVISCSLTCPMFTMDSRVLVSLCKVLIWMNIPVVQTNP